MPGNALTTIQLRPLGNSFNDHVVFAVGIAFGVGKNEFRGRCMAILFPLAKLVDKGSWQQYGPFLPILRFKSPTWLCGDVNHKVLQIDVAKSDILRLLIAESGADQELEKDRLIWRGIAAAWP